MQKTISHNVSAVTKTKKSKLINDIKRDRLLYLMLLPVALYYIIFKYLPMLGVSIAFKDYLPFLGIIKSPWAGLKHFERLFSNPDFFRLLRNSIVLAMYNIVFTFPLPIIIALLLNEIKSNKFKKTIQSLIYMPHFISWVVVVGICFTMLSNQDGIVNNIIASIGGHQINFLGSKAWFRPLITMQVAWKETGWGTIIYLAALTSVDVQLYEAAIVDGANRWHQLLHITLPAIKSTIVILLILRMGAFLDSGFDQLFLMVNSLNRDIGDVFDTYVYNALMTQNNLGMSSAAGLYQSVVGFVLVILVNWVIKKISPEDALI